MKKKFNSYSECTNLKEYKMLKRMSFHPNIVQLYETFITPTTKEFYLIMEYMNGGNLYQFINERNETNRIINLEEIKSILLQILSALSHIHQVEGIFHRDMKPENLLISYHPYHNKCGDNIIIKLADFGLAADIKKYRLC
jgi:serine/threonine protein kinase